MYRYMCIHGERYSIRTHSLHDPKSMYIMLATSVWDCQSLTHKSGAGSIGVGAKCSHRLLVLVPRGAKGGEGLRGRYKRSKGPCLFSNVAYLFVYKSKQGLLR